MVESADTEDDNHSNPTWEEMGEEISGIGFHGEIVRVWRGAKRIQVRIKPESDDEGDWKTDQRPRWSSSTPVYKESSPTSHSSSELPPPPPSSPPVDLPTSDGSSSLGLMPGTRKPGRKARIRQEWVPRVGPARTIASPNEFEAEAGPEDKFCATPGPVLLEKETPKLETKKKKIYRHRKDLTKLLQKSPKSPLSVPPMRGFIRCRRREAAEAAATALDLTPKNKGNKTQKTPAGPSKPPAAKRSLLFPSTPRTYTSSSSDASTPELLKSRIKSKADPKKFRNDSSLSSFWRTPARKQTIASTSTSPDLFEGASAPPSPPSDYWKMDPDVIEYYYATYHESPKFQKKYYTS